MTLISKKAQEGAVKFFDALYGLHATGYITDRTWDEIKSAFLRLNDELGAKEIDILIRKAVTQKEHD